MAIPISCDLCVVGKHTPYSGLHASVPAEITALRRQIKTVPARQILFREGEVPSQACTLHSGWAFRYRMLADGKRQILSFHIPGDYIDSIALHDDDSGKRQNPPKHITRGHERFRIGVGFERGPLPAAS